MKSVSFKAVRRQHAKSVCSRNATAKGKSIKSRKVHVWLDVSAGVSSILDVLGPQGVIYYSGHGAKKDTKNLRSDASAIRKDFASVMQRTLAD
jgi:hypothetical protein